jgi:hypothetical protein
MPNLGDLSQLVGAIAVVVSLIYVSRQIKQNTKAIKAANATTVQKNFIDLANSLYSDREVAALVLKGRSGSSSLNAAEQLAAYAWFFNMLRTAELAHFICATAISITICGRRLRDFTAPTSQPRA